MMRLGIWALALLCLMAWPTMATAVTVQGHGLQQLQENVNHAVSVVRPSVASVKALKRQHRGGTTGQIWYESIGSGFVVDARGYVLTNYHVIEDAEQIHVGLWGAGKREFVATVADADKSLDMALLKVQGAGPLVPARFGDSRRLESGDWVVSVGSPYGFEHTASMGIVSALHRDLTIAGKAYNDMVQTDANINQGNSGGPLINMQGHVVGVGTAIYSPEGAYTGVGFAIPINRAKHFFSRTTGAVVAAALITPAKTKLPVDLNKKPPNDKAHAKFSDCTSCHTITGKTVVSTQLPLPHDPVGECSTCHTMVNEPPTTKGVVPVAAVGPAQDVSLSYILTHIVFKLGMIILVASTVFVMLGVGGGFLYVPILLSCGIDFQTAATTSLIMLTVSQISGLYTFFKSGLVDLKLAIILEMPTLVAAFIGGVCAHYFNIMALHLMFAAMLFLAGYSMLRERGFTQAVSGGGWRGPWRWNREFKGRSYHLDLLPALPMAFIVGLLGGMLGLGGGWLKVPMMVALFNIPMKIAVATSSLMVPVTGFFGFLGHSVMGHFDPLLAGALSVFAIIGAQIGARISVNTEAGVLRFSFAFVLGLVGVWMIWRMF
jgi:S1-C subfamily serine protease/uncharacterized membrane protein YfcA